MDTSARSAYSISPEEFAPLIGTPNAPLILDVRREIPFSESSHTIAAAKRCNPEHLQSFAATNQPRDVIVYCVYGHNVGEESAAILRKYGWNAKFLAGGIKGGQPGVDTPQHISAWEAVQPLQIVKRRDLGVTGGNPSRWITRARPKIDRVACPWLIRRFIDPDAEFFYVETAAVFAEAKRLDAVAYDIPGALISHDGELCSFDTLLRAFGLQHDPVLGRLAQIVRAADTDLLESAPQASGLLAVSLGLSALHADHDIAMLGAAMPVYDALYAWCRIQDSEAQSRRPELIGGKQI